MISLCITTYNRSHLVIEAIRDVLDDDRVSEIVIVDDASEPVIFEQLEDLISDLENEKIHLYRNPKNLDCYLNKKRAVELAFNDWVIIFDSDNIISKQYIDILYKHKESSHVGFEWDYRKIYQPSFAKPLFDFRFLQGITFDRSIVGFWLDRKNTETMLNAMNYFVNRHEWLKVFDDKVDPVTSDSLYQNYNWLAADNSILVVPELEYEHRIHDGSHYRLNVARTPQGFHESIMVKLRAMK